MVWKKSWYLGCLYDSCFSDNNIVGFCLLFVEE